MDECFAPWLTISAQWITVLLMGYIIVGMRATRRAQRQIIANQAELQQRLTAAGK
jgi:hypothetical protein